MALRSVWRRFTARKHKRSSFYESQDVMRRAIEAEKAARKGCAHPAEAAAVTPKPGQSGAS